MNVILKETIESLGGQGCGWICQKLSASAEKSHSGHSSKQKAHGSAKGQA